MQSTTDNTNKSSFKPVINFTMHDCDISISPDATKMTITPKPPTGKNKVHTLYIDSVDQKHIADFTDKPFDKEKKSFFSFFTDFMKAKWESAEGPLMTFLFLLFSSLIAVAGLCVAGYDTYSQKKTFNKEKEEYEASFELRKQAYEKAELQNKRNAYANLFKDRYFSKYTAAMESAYKAAKKEKQKSKEAALNIAPEQSRTPNEAPQQQYGRAQQQYGNIAPQQRYAQAPQQQYGIGTGQNFQQQLGGNTIDDAKIAKLAAVMQEFTVSVQNLIKFTRPGTENKNALQNIAQEIYDIMTKVKIPTPDKDIIFDKKLEELKQVLIGMQHEQTFERFEPTFKALYEKSKECKKEVVESISLPFITGKIQEGIHSNLSNMQERNHAHNLAVTQAFRSTPLGVFGR